jgi:hypothetical protein
LKRLRAWISQVAKPNQSRPQPSTIDAAWRPQQGAMIAMATNEDLDSDDKKLSKELLDITRSVQKAIAAMRSDIHDFRAEHIENMAKVKRELQKQELRHKKVWI